MSEEKIVIIINKDGEIESETFDMYGDKCIQELDKIMKGLILEVKSTKKPEFFKSKVSVKSKVEAKNE